MVAAGRGAAGVLGEGPFAVLRPAHRVQSSSCVLARVFQAGPKPGGGFVGSVLLRIRVPGEDGPLPAN